MVSLACSLDLGYARPASSVAITHVLLPACKWSSPEKIVLVNHVRTGPNHQIQLSRPPLAPAVCHEEPGSKTTSIPSISLELS